MIKTLITPRSFWILACSIILINWACKKTQQSTSPNSASKLLQVKIGTVSTGSREILRSALNEAISKKYHAVVLLIDSPGGALNATRDMVKDIMNADVPIIAWVGPDGARAASAAAFLTVASHYAIMSPGTNIGAASPVTMGGAEQSETMKNKLMQDTEAFMESIAKKRGRNIEITRSFVTTAFSIGAEEALNEKVIDAIINDGESISAIIAGKKIVLHDGKEITFSGDLEVDEFQTTTKQELLSLLSSPDIFYLLFMAGLIGLGFELTHPGSIFPGVFGAIALLLAMTASATLPINWGAALLLMLGILFMTAEIFVPSFGVLGVGGLIAFVLGSFLLIDTEMGPGVSWMSILPTTLFLAGFLAFIGYAVIRADAGQIQTGNYALLGKPVEILENANESGVLRVRVNGEIWQASLADPTMLDRSPSELKVLKVEGMRLILG